MEWILWGRWTAAAAAQKHQQLLVCCFWWWCCCCHFNNCLLVVQSESTSSLSSAHASSSWIQQQQQLQQYHEINNEQQRWLSLPRQQQRLRRNSSSTVVLPSEPKIIGGTPAVEGEYLWFASTSPDSNYWCGAALIAPEVLITAAHCAIAFPTGAIVGAYEFHNLNSSPNSILVTITKHIPHPEYTAGTWDVNDVLLLHIHPAVTTIAPIAINFNASFPTFQPPDTIITTTNNLNQNFNLNLTIMGFGMTQDNTMSSLSQTLLTATVHEQSISYCRNLYQLPAIQVETHLCAMLKTPTESFMACDGDSGGPIIAIHHVHPETATNPNKQPVLLGVLSFGALQCTKGPSVYTRLSGYRDFLQTELCHLTRYLDDQLQCPHILFIKQKQKRRKRKRRKKRKKRKKRKQH